MKRILSLITAIALTMAVFIVPIKAEEDITVSNVTYTVNGKESPMPQNGYVTAGVEVSGTGDATLIVALYDRETGRFKDIASSGTTRLSNETVTLSAGVTMTDFTMEQMRVFVWDSMSGLKPYSVPADEEIYLKAESNKSRVILYWYSCDGITDGDYTVYRDGEEIATVTDKGGYIDYGVSGAHTYQVKSGGRVSNDAAVSECMSFSDAAKLAVVSTEKGNLVPYTHKGDGDKGKLLASRGGDGYYTNRLGRTAFIPTIDTDITDTTIYVIGYKDTGSVKFATGGTYTPQNGLDGDIDTTYPLNTQWGSVAGRDYTMGKAYTVAINSSTILCDFYAADANGTYHIKDVYAFKTSDVTAEIDTAMRSLVTCDDLHPDGVSISVSNSAAVLDGMSIYETGGGDNRFEYGTDHIVLGTTTNGSGTAAAMKPRMNVADDYICGGEPLIIEVEYSTEDANRMSFQWANKNGVVVGDYVILKKDGQRHTATLILEDEAYFANGFEKKFDLCMCGQANKTIKLYSLKIKNASHFPIKEYSLYKDEDIAKYVYPKKVEKTTINDSVTGREYYYVNFEGREAIRPYVTQQSWNSDGTKFIFGDDATKAMFEYDTVKGTVKFIDNASVGSSLNAVVTADDKIYYGCNDGTRCYNWKTGEIKLITDMSFGTMSVTDDGKYITGYGGSSSEVKRLNAETGELSIATKDFISLNANSLGVGHTIINPKNGNLQLFCNEGATEKIPDRVWIQNWATNSMYNLYDQTDGAGNQLVCSGHELWGLNGDKVYWVNYKNINGGQDATTGLVRANPDGSGVEYLSADTYAHWHCYPSGDDNWVASDAQPHKINNVSHSNIYLTNANTNAVYNIAQFVIPRSEHPYQPHPCISRNGDKVSWQLANADGVVGCAWADVSDITKK